MTATTGAAFEGVVPSRLSPADREQIEGRTQQIGRSLLERSQASPKLMPTRRPTRNCSPRCPATPRCGPVIRSSTTAPAGRCRG